MTPATKVLDVKREDNFALKLGVLQEFEEKRFQVLAPWEEEAALWSFVFSHYAFDLMRHAYPNHTTTHLAGFSQ
jgi:hypothetical protein